MPKRYKMSGHNSRRYFTKTASHTHAKNMPRRMPMRGGIRL